MCMYRNISLQFETKRRGKQIYRDVGERETTQCAEFLDLRKLF